MQKKICGYRDYNLRSKGEFTLQNAFEESSRHFPFEESRRQRFSSFE
jgi:hypothetical protein